MQAIVNLPTGLQVLYLLKHIMEMADVYQLCSREVPWSEWSVRVKGCDLVNLNVTATAWPAIALQYPILVSISGKNGQQHTSESSFTRKLGRILFSLFS